MFDHEIKSKKNIVRRKERQIKRTSLKKEDQNILVERTNNHRDFSRFNTLLTFMMWIVGFDERLIRHTLGSGDMENEKKGENRNEFVC
jgi:hypothetical protein